MSREIFWTVGEDPVLAALRGEMGEKDADLGDTAVVLIAYVRRGAVLSGFSVDSLGEASTCLMPILAPVAFAISEKEQKEECSDG